MKPIQQVAEITISYKPTVCKKPLIASSIDAYRELKDFFPEELIHLQEQFVVMYLNRANRIIGIYRLSTGGITGTVADPRLILGTALKVAATSIILSHNHPSGNMQPSKADELLTNKIKEAAKFMDIQLSDHIVISPIDGAYYSFADEGLI
jgi:DNA repair protein RadC